MVYSEDKADTNTITTAAKKRRLRRKRLTVARASQNSENKVLKSHSETTSRINGVLVTPELVNQQDCISKVINSSVLVQEVTKMSSADNKSREDVLAAREAKKLAKQKGKSKVPVQNEVKDASKDLKKDVPITKPDADVNVCKQVSPKPEVSPKKGKDEVDRAITNVIENTEIVEKSKDDVKAERAAKKAAKQAKKKKDGESGDVKKDSDMTVQDVVETLKDIVIVAREVQDVTAKVQAINLEPKRPGETGTKKPDPEVGKAKPQAEDSGKSKADLRAERRAKQEAQRAAKQASVQQKVAAAPEAKNSTKAEESVKPAQERPPKAKSVEKTKPKSQNVTRVNWFQHLHMQHDKEALMKIPVNSANLHPAIVKLGVQMASKVVTGSNARCIALLDALKKMVSDYTLPAKTEFARGLEAHLATSLDFLWSMRQPSASQTNAVKFFRHHLTQLPHNVGEFDAKKTLQEEIDRYIREQIDMAGEAISLAVREKISDGDTILTYGGSSLIERILREAWVAGVQFRCVVVGARVGAAAARELVRRLAACRLPTTYVDITAVSYVMPTINKVILGASSLLVNGSVLGAAGTAQVALLARACNVPVLVACETHKFSERVQTDAFVYNEIGDPDELVDKSDDNSPLKDWRSNPNLTPLNLTYDVTPPSLVTAVVTELAILPCTSAPVVLRFKLSEYGIQG